MGRKPLDITKIVTQLINSDFMIMANVPSGKSSSMEKILVESDIALFKANNFERTMYYAFVGEDMKEAVMDRLKKAGLECLAVKVSRVV